MVVLLHKADAKDSVLLIHTLSRLAENVVLWKPRTAHTARSSFYLVAKGVRPGCEAARAALAGWKARWVLATFGRDGGDGGDGGGEMEEKKEEEKKEEEKKEEEKKVRGVLRDFGPELVRLAEPVFAVQAKALSTAPWMKKKKGDGSKVVLPGGVDGEQGSQE